MTAPKHTPGPWFYSQESIDPDWYIVKINGGLIVANVNSHLRQVANARIIAAAPDLLEALHAIVEARDALEAARMLSDFGGECAAQEFVDRAIYAARAAIAKAEGNAE